MCASLGFCSGALTFRRAIRHTVAGLRPWTHPVRENILIYNRRSIRTALKLPLLWAFVCFLVVSPQSRAQTAPPSDNPVAKPAATAPTLSVDVKVVTLPVTVRDKHGAIVNNLTKDDFVLQEDSHPQAIKYFTLEKNLPLTLGLLVDTSMSQRNVLDQERTASRSFLDAMLTNPKDRAFVVQFDREVDLLQDLTSSKQTLQSALAKVAPSQPPRNSGGGSDGGNDDPDVRHMRAGTLLYDAVFLASDELMKKQQGRKALIILSDGVDHGSKESLADAIEAAQRADTVVYSILFADNHEHNGGGDHHGGGGYPGGGQRGGGYPGHGGGYPGGGGGWPGGSGGGGRPGGGGGGQPRGGADHTDGKKVLERLSKETGGRMYEVSKKESIEQIYASITEELRSQYTLAYTPDKANPGSGFHKIELTTRDKHLTVQTREGYYSER